MDGIRICREPWCPLTPALLVYLFAPLVLLQGLMGVGGK